jgi:hypothetical protein
MIKKEFNHVEKTFLLIIKDDTFQIQNMNHQKIIGIIEKLFQFLTKEIKV